MSLYCAVGAVDADFSADELKNLLIESLAKLGPRKSVLAVPPDITRLHSQAGALTRFVWEYYRDRLQAVLPAIGTHTPMEPAQIDHMFGDMPHDLFRVHNWRTDVVTLGEVPARSSTSGLEGKLDFSWPAQVNRLIVEGGFDLILSIGQVVPHEVIGMANYTKNILVGTGGREGINRSHYLGAVYGMERIMGRADNPVRAVLNYASDRFLRRPAHRLRTNGRGPQPAGVSPCAGSILVTTSSASIVPPSSASKSISRGSTSRSAKQSSISILTSSTPPGSATRPYIAPVWLSPTAGNSSFLRPR